MEKVLNEQTEELTQSAEADKAIGEQTSEVSLGKFKDVASLLSAYNSLQSEFTKRCQKIKELESVALGDKENSPPKEKPSEQPIGTNPLEKEQVLKDYLKELLGAKQQAILLDRAGLNIMTPPSKPKTIAEAGLLAKDLLNNVNN